MGKLLVVASRFLLLLLSLLLALPAIAFAQINTITITRAWTQDEKGQDKFLFLPGNPVHYAVIVNNTYSHTVNATIKFEAAGPVLLTTICSTTGLQTGCSWNPTYRSIYQYHQDIELPVGLSSYYSPSNIPADAHTGPYGLTVDVGWPLDTGGSAGRQTYGPFTVEDTLPYPSWWNSDVCDDSFYYNRKGLHTFPLGGSYRGVLACGPRPIADNAPDNEVILPPNCGQENKCQVELEWECVELSMRFMYLAYGINPYYVGRGDFVADKYNDDNRILVPVANNVSGKAGPLPDPGDILSYNYDAVNDVGHTSVVVYSDVDSSGNGSIKVLEQNIASNVAPNGKETLQVKNWHVSGVKNWLHHTLDIWPQSGPPNTSVIIRGEGFQANEAINLYLDVFLTEITADSNGTFAATIQVPDLPPSQYVVSVVGATTTPITQTVFYVTKDSRLP